MPSSDAPISWNWQLQGTVPTDTKVQVFDIDGFDNSAATVAALHAHGTKVICYIDFGSSENFRPDDASFPKSVQGSTNGWPGEKWLDIRQLSVLEPIMTARMKMCVQKGFDALEPDNIDGYSNSTGFPLTAQDQLTYNTWIAKTAHSMGLSVGLKNDTDQTSQLEPDFDWALNEQCNEYRECDTENVFVRSNKAVFNAEYSGGTGFCSADVAEHINGARFGLDLDASSLRALPRELVTTHRGGYLHPAVAVRAPPEGQAATVVDGLGAESESAGRTPSKRTRMRPSKMTLATTFVTLAALVVFAGACSSSSKSSSSTTPTTTATTVPAAPAAVTITANDYSYSGVPATMTAGIVDVNFVNKGTVNHEMAFLKVTDNTDTKAIFASLGNVLNGKAFPADFLAVNGVHDTDPGKTTSSQFNLTPGNWIALCTDTGIVGSTKDGEPHFMRGMYKQIKVTGTGGTTIPTADATLTAHDYGFDVSQLKAGTQTVVFHNIGPVQWHFADIMEFPKGTTVAQATGQRPEVPRFAGTAAGRCPGADPCRDVSGHQPGLRQHVHGELHLGPHVPGALLRLRQDGRAPARHRPPHVEGLHDLLIGRPPVLEERSGLRPGPLRVVA